MVRLHLAALALFFAPLTVRSAEVIRADVVVYTATAGGATASIAAARQGASVVLIEPRNHVGGMFSGGLSHSDVHGQEKLIGGLAREIFERMAVRYLKNSAQGAFNFEPHVAEETLRRMLDEADVKLYFGERLDTVEKVGPRIKSIKTESGKTFSAKVFIDAGYEGDLMARSNVPYTVGREGRAKYGESLAGRTELIPCSHQFGAPVSAVKDGKLLPHVTPQAETVATGEGDGKIQGYCFRLCLTDNPENMLPIEKPEGYNADDYELLRRYYKAGVDRASSGFHYHRVPNGKCDLNSIGAVSTNLLGAQHEYPEASYERREEIWNAHLKWAQGLLWFIQNEPDVPEAYAKRARGWGLCKDEFVDTGGWPHQLYIREGRRMLGAYVVTQNDLMSKKTQPDSIGMCGYNIDLREVQWVEAKTYIYPRAERIVYLEGYLSHPVSPWQVPYRAITPKAEDCTNLLVPVCASMSTVAYGSFRMESGYMIAGHSSGVAAALAAREEVPVQKVRYDDLSRLLKEQGQVLELSDVQRD